MPSKKKIILKSPATKANKPDTGTRAEITANLKFTRGKQLVEHAPHKLIPDPQNPRPGEVINDVWLNVNLLLGTENSLCKYNSQENNYVIPEFSELNLEDKGSIKESYNFLRDLAFSILNDGLIEPIEVFLADKINDPEYFVNNSLEYGYVILEGHQRRLAAMMAGVVSVTCIEITDESLLAKLKIKHRKLRRQLSENNLRKSLTVAQNFTIVKRLLADPDNQTITSKDLAAIIGLNQAIAGALKTICVNYAKLPAIFIEKIENNELTFKIIRTLVAKPNAEIIKLLKGEKEQIISIPKVKPRGLQGGAIKRSATFKIKNEKESLSLQKLLYARFPELGDTNLEEPSFKSLEKLLNKIKELAVQDEA